MKSVLKISKTGQKILTVFYSRKLDNFEEVIKTELKAYGLKSKEITIIAQAK